jgi:hypothetical protein
MDRPFHGCDAFKDLPSYAEFSRITNESIRWAQELLNPCTDLDECEASREVLNNPKNAYYTGDSRIATPCYRDICRNEETVASASGNAMPDEFNHMDLFYALESEVEQEARMEYALINTRNMEKVAFQSSFSRRMPEKGNYYKMYKTITTVRLYVSPSILRFILSPNTSFLLRNQEERINPLRSSNDNSVLITHSKKRIRGFNMIHYPNSQKFEQIPEHDRPCIKVNIYSQDSIGSRITKYTDQHVGRSSLCDKKFVWQHDRNDVLLRTDRCKGKRI